MVNRGVDLKITYANSKLEKYFNDYKSMQKKIPADWVRSVKKTMDRLVAADKFGDFLSLGLGKPEQLKGGGEQIRYSLHVTANVRLIIELNATKIYNKFSFFRLIFKFLSRIPLFSKKLHSQKLL